MMCMVPLCVGGPQQYETAQNAGAFDNNVEYSRPVIGPLGGPL